MSPQPARRRGRAFVLRLAASGLATAVCATLLAQAPAWEFDLAITRLDRSDIRLHDFTRQGYRCARVARPEGAHVPGHVAILMGRPKDPRVWPAVSDIEVIVGGTEMRRESFERDINRLAARLRDVRLHDRRGGRNLINIAGPIERIYPRHSESGS